MGHHFGNLARVRHMITYSLSPFEQKAFANYLSKGIPNVWRRFSASFFKVAPRECVFFSCNLCCVYLMNTGWELSILLKLK